MCHYCPFFNGKKCTRGSADGAASCDADEVDDGTDKYGDGAV